MQKGIDIMSWYTITILPDEVWNLVRWIAFFCKLASLAFAIPVVALIVFDFCLWIWRLFQPTPRDFRSSKTLRTPSEERRYIAMAPTPSTSASVSARDHTGTEKRAAFVGDTET